MQASVLYTYASATPVYQTFDLGSVGQAARAWRNLPKKARPAQATPLDNTDGWVFAVACQGVIFSDHDCYAVVPGTTHQGGITVYAWSDQIASVTGDPYDYTARLGMKVEFPPLKAAPNLAGGINTNQWHTFYYEDPGQLAAQQAALSGVLNASGNPVTVAAWSDFVPPAEADTKYGIWVRDTARYTAHVDVAAAPPVKWENYQGQK